MNVGRGEWTQTDAIFLPELPQVLAGSQIGRTFPGLRALGTRSSLPGLAQSRRVPQWTCLKHKRDVLTTWYVKTAAANEQAGITVMNARDDQWSVQAMVGLLKRDTYTHTRCGRTHCDGRWCPGGLWGFGLWSERAGLVRGSSAG